MRRKIFTYSMFFTGGIVSVYLLEGSAGFIAVMGICLVLILYRLRLCRSCKLSGDECEDCPLIKKRRIIKQLIFIAVFFLLGSFVMILQQESFDRGSALDGREGGFRIQVRSAEPDKWGGIRLEGRIYGQDYRDARLIEGLLSMIYPADSAVVSVKKFSGGVESVIGREFTFSGVIEKPGTRGNPRCFDYSKHLRSKGITHIVKTRFITPTYRNEYSLKNRFVTRLFLLREGFLETIPGDESQKALVRGVLFGDLSRMEEEVQEDFRMNGTAHILAVSGLHIGILYAIYRKLQTRFNSNILTMVMILFLLTYGMLTMWAVSVVRASILVFLAMIADKCNRRYDLTTALGIGGFFILLMNPHAITGVSFQMSFIAVLSIAFFVKPLREVLPDIVPDGIVVAIAVQLGILPYVAYVFNMVPVFSLLFNVPVAWIVSIFVPAGIMSFFCFSVGVPVLGRFVAILAELLMQINAFLSANGIFAVDVVSPPLWALVLFYGIVFFSFSEFAFILFKRKKFSLIFAYGCCIIVLSIGVGYMFRNLFDEALFTMVDVGQGDCLCVMDRRKVLLFDGGGSRNYNVGKKILKPYLLKNGRWCVSFAQATHLDTDHYLGLKQLAECYKVETIRFRGKIGERFRFSEGLSAEIIYGPKAGERNPDNENDNSLIIKVNNNGLTTLVTGDISSEKEADILEYFKGTNKLRADILKVPHHGSRYSSSEEFIRAVNPRVAIIGVGAGNTFGHPAKEVLDRYRKLGIPVYRTDLDGAIGLRLDRGRIVACTVRKREGKKS